MYRALDLPLDTHPEHPEPAAAPAELDTPKAEQLHEALLALDSVLGSGRRVLLDASLAGATRFLVEDNLDTTSATRIYPDRTTPRVVARARGVPLTPGHVVALELLGLPSGPTQQGAVFMGFSLDSVLGSVALEVTYHAGAISKTVSVELELAPSEVEPHAGEPGDVWGSLLELDALALPELVDAGDSAWATWAGPGVTVDLVLRYSGSPRVVDCHVAERPLRAAVDPTDDRWPAAMYTEIEQQTAGSPLGSYPSEWPTTRLTDDDPGCGTVAMLEGIRALGRLGPVLFSWTSHREGQALADIVSYSDGSGDDEAPPLAFEGDEWTLLQPPIQMSGSSALPGWPLGNFARDAVHAGEVLDGRAGVVPVWLAIYWRASPGVTAQLELRAASWSWSTMHAETSDDAWAWSIVPGWLEAGLGPHAPIIARAYVRTTSPVGVVFVRDLVVSTPQ